MLGVSRFMFILFFLMIPLTSFAAPMQYISPGDEWNYTFSDPEAGWQDTSFDDSSWSVGNAPFGNYNSCYAGECDFIPNTDWPVGEDLFLRYEFELTSQVTMDYSIGVDNGFDLWVNGNYITGANAEGFTYNWEYTGGIAESLFNVGANVVALRLEDHGGLTAFDMMLVGDDSGIAPVPEPSTLLLLGSGLAGLAFWRRKQS